MISVGRGYNALTGAELKQAILNEVSRALDNAGINSPAVTYPQCSWSWSLHLRQQDSKGEPASETPERKIEAGSSLSVGEKLMNVLGGGSKRYQHNPPSPTEVRQEEKLPLPEA
jgi:hypothetical protein